MSILHLSPTFYSTSSVIGGGERYVVYVAKSIFIASKAMGTPEVNVLVAFGEQNGMFRVAEDIDLHVIHARAWDYSSLDASVIRNLIKDFDVVFVHQCLCGFGLFLAAQVRIMGKILVGLDHGGGEHPSASHSPLVGTMFDFYQAYSDFGAHAFADLDGKVVVARGPVDTEYYTPSACTSPKEGVVALGRYLPHKGFDRIIKALPNDLKLTIIGNKYDNKYFNYLNDISSGKLVKFAEGLDDDAVRRVLQTASLFVHASSHFDYEGRFYAKPELLGLAPLEALACGIPALVSNAGSLPELSIVDGCEVFSDDQDLARLLRSHSKGEIRWPSPSKIHEDVDAKFGMLQYGIKVLDSIQSCVGK